MSDSDTTDRLLVEIKAAIGHRYIAHVYFEVNESQGIDCHFRVLGSENAPELSNALLGRVLYCAVTRLLSEEDLKKIKVTDLSDVQGSA